MVSDLEKSSDKITVDKNINVSSDANPITKDSDISDAEFDKVLAQHGLLESDEEDLYIDPDDYMDGEYDLGDIDIPEEADISSMDGMPEFILYMKDNGIDISDVNASFTARPALYDIYNEFMNDDDMVNHYIDKRRLINGGNVNTVDMQNADGVTKDIKTPKASHTIARKTADIIGSGPILGTLLASDITAQSADIGFGEAVGANFVWPDFGSSDIPTKVALLYVIKKITYHLEGLAMNTAENSICGFRKDLYPIEHDRILVVLREYSSCIPERAKRRAINQEFNPLFVSDRYKDMYNKLALAVYDTVMTGINPYIYGQTMPYYMNKSEMRLLYAITAVWYLAPAHLNSYIKAKGKLALSAGIGSGSVAVTDKIRLDLLEHHHSALKESKGYSKYGKGWSNRIDKLSFKEANV